MIASDMVVTYEEIKKGKVVDTHTNPGIEWAYNIILKADVYAKLSIRTWFWKLKTVYLSMQKWNIPLQHLKN
jgi:hypothetical protein